MRGTGLSSRAWIAALLAAAALTQLATPARARGVVELPVSFAVHNTNTSAVPCPSDGRRYTVRGHLTPPTGAAPGAVAVYLTGLDTGEWNWRLTAVPGYDWAREMARAGETSLTLDMLGYGASGHPDGSESCYGSQADVTHQVISELRAGHYRVDGARPVRFDRVVLVGHDVGGAFAQIEAYSYRDVDGLVVATWADQGQTPLLLERANRAGAVCATNGGGYFYMEQPAEYRADLFDNVDPSVFDAFLGRREPNPCGYMSTALAAIATDRLRVPDIHVPVLIAIGADDKIFTHDGWEQQRGLYSGSRDVTAATIPDTGHYPMLERSVPRFRALVAGWLARRGL
jgi:pimeloyl-ACP methyl ester carboxylesterase